MEGSARTPGWTARGNEMATDNQVMLVGNLTDDPELRFTPNGAAVANFRLAVTPRVRDGDAWKDGETSFFRVNVWRQMAENVAESMTKGSRAVVVGRLRTRSWETPEGEKRSVPEVAEAVAPRDGDPAPGRSTMDLHDSRRVRTGPGEGARGPVRR